MAVKAKRKEPLLGGTRVSFKTAVIVITLAATAGLAYLIFYATHASSNPYSCPDPKPTLRQGSSGNCVKYLQHYIFANSGRSISVDGAFGPKTRDYVISFQECAGLTPDGIVGPNTWSGIKNRITSYGRLCSGSSDVNRAAAPIRAAIDVADCNIIGGWIYDTNNSQYSLDLGLYIGQTTDVNGPANFYGIVANGDRPDVRSHFGISGNHGFTMNTPAQFKDGKSHVVKLMPRWRVWAWLPGPTKTLKC